MYVLCAYVCVFAGVQHCVVPDWQRADLYSWLLPEPCYSLEVPINGSTGKVTRTHQTSTVPGEDGHSTHIHTYVHADTQRTCTSLCTNIYLQCTCISACAWAPPLTHTHTTHNSHMHICTHTGTLNLSGGKAIVQSLGLHTHTHTCAHSHTHSHTHTHTHTHLYLCLIVLSVLLLPGHVPWWRKCCHWSRRWDAALLARLL